MAMVALGVVVNTDALFSKITKNSSKTTSEQNYPPGTILVRRAQMGAKLSTGTITIAAYPLDLSDLTVPLVGEHVWLYNATDGNSRLSKRWYYSKIVNVHNTLNTNVLPDIYDVTVQESRSKSYQQGGLRISQPSGVAPEYISHTEQEIAPLQPYEGDRLISSRYGSAIRFSSNINKGQSNYFKPTTPWKGSGTNSPIIMLTSGLVKSTDFYTIENPNEDKSYIYLASDQSITMSPAQAKIGTAQPPANYTNGQIVIGSDRLFFNARRDDISLVSKTTVNVATPAWAIDMDKFFTIIESLTQELVNLAQGSATFATGAGPTGISTNLAALQNILTQLKAMKQ